METDDIEKRDVLHLRTPPDNETETTSDEYANEQNASEYPFSTPGTNRIVHVPV
jgi:hypothetical protein